MLVLVLVHRQLLVHPLLLQLKLTTDLPTGEACIGEAIVRVSLHLAFMLPFLDVVMMYLYASSYCLEAVVFVCRVLLGTKI